MKDLLLNANGDLDLSTGDAQIIDDIAQAILVRLRWHKGEWPINTDYGVPYFDNILGQKYNETYITQDIFDVFSEIVGLRTVNSLDIKKVKRGVFIKFSVTGDNGRESGEIVI
ncbi:MAG: hypothetical protein IJS71_08245 [Clostridia bacterium]|nr:hypothetical protein [Clostridia bacterium]